jgi:26S proteasome regulatory subunit N2
LSFVEKNLHCFAVSFHCIKLCLGNEIVQHGASLGLGVAAMATNNAEVYEQLKNIVYSDSAVAGEAAAISLGLVMLGSGSEQALDDMLTYAHETQHEKIIRGLAIGIALVYYDREEEADIVIEQLLLDKDPLLRYGAMYTIGLAYSGTANNSAIKR